MDDTFLTVVKNKYIEILIVGLVLWLAVFIINKALQIFFKRTEFIEDKKKKTIESLVKSVTKYTASICFVFYVISLFFHDFGKILAGAGVAGIVIGFGAQTLIRDILAGIFLIYERQIHKGDYVTVNNLFNGTIEEIGLRSLQIREWSGKLLTISNGDIRQIQNYNMHYMRITESVLISANQNPDTAFQALETACDNLNQMHHDFLKKMNSSMPLNRFKSMALWVWTSWTAGLSSQWKEWSKMKNISIFALAVRKEMIKQLHQHDVKLLEDLVYPQPAK